MLHADRLRVPEAAAAETGLKLKTAEESLTARTAEVTVLNRRLADAVKGGGSGLSAEMLAENKRLKEEAAAVGKALEAAAVEALTLKNQHRAAQLELVQQREALQRIEVLRLAVEKENAALTKQLELEKASGELSSVELRNLRERNVKLEGDMKSWSDSAVSKSIEAGDAANRELAAEIKALKEQLATQNRELKVLLDQKSSQEKALAAATMELAGKKSALLLAEEKLKKAGEGLARLGKLEPEFKTLQVNFQAMQKELAAGRKAAEAPHASKTALAAAQTRLKELESVAAKFLAEQKRNQSLAEEVSRLKGELEARPVAAAVPAEPVPAVSGVAAPADRTPAELLAAGRREEAMPLLSIALLRHVTAILQIGSKLCSVYEDRGRLDQADEILAWLCPFLQGVEQPGSINCLTKFRAAALGGRAQLAWKAGRQEDARALLRQALALAARFDAAPSYRADAIRWYEGPETAMAYDSMGATAEDAVRQAFTQQGEDAAAEAFLAALQAEG